MNEKGREKQMGRRCRAAGMVLTLFAAALSVRLYGLAMGSGLQQAAAAQQTYVLEAARGRGTIYDCRLRPLTNVSRKTMTAAVASPAAVTAIRQQLSEDMQQTVLTRLESGKPALFEGELAPGTAGAVTFWTEERYGEDFAAAHVIGYVDRDGAGVCGIEAAYDDLLRVGGSSVQVRYQADAWGRTLNGTDLTVQRTDSESGIGVVLTLDRDMQQLAAEVARHSLQAGAIVILESATGKIRAMVSAPDYPPDDVEAAMQQENSPLVNRTLCAYNVGSVFKLVGACCATERGDTDLTLDCTGTLTHGGRVFQCIYGNAHGQVDLTRSVALSCNGYFIRLAERTGAAPLYRMAQQLGFGAAIGLAPGISSEAGRMPALQDLSAPAALANFSFGQGVLLATPLQVAGMVQTIANDGIRVTPTLVEGTVDSEGTLSAADAPDRVRVLSADSARSVRQMMVEAVVSGTASPAAPAQGGAGAKTATAETGWMQQGEAVVQAWCAGFYPADTAAYTIVVFAENGRSGSRACAPIFRQIADGLWKIGAA